MVSRQQQWPPDDLVRDVLDLKRDLKQAVMTQKGSDWYDFSSSVVWASSGTQPALGNGFLRMRYQRIGRTCLINFLLLPGSTTTVGTGTYTFTVPFTIGYGGAGGVRLFDSTSNAQIMGQVMCNAGDTFVAPWAPTSGSPHTVSQMTGTVPITFSNGDVMVMSFWYEAAEGQ